jgi:peptide/nickel transport system substrate-binding protein
MSSERGDTSLQRLIEHRLTRRDLLKGTAGIAAVSALGPLATFVSGCGTSSGSSSPTPSAGSPKKGGNLRLGAIGGGTADVIDAHLSNRTIDGLRGKQLYDTLLRRDHHYQIQPHLAEEVSANATGDIWTIRLRPDVTFHNGKTLGADDVIFTFKKILNPKFPNSVSTMLEEVDPKKLKRLDERTVEVHLKKPNAVFDDSLSFNNFVIQPVGYDAKKPVGTGPFVFKSFEAGQRSVFTANPNYWGEGPYVDQVETIDFADTAALVNALLGRVTDAIAEMETSEVSTVQGAGFNTVVSDTGRVYYYFYRMDLQPWTDVRVRQAMRLMINRKEMVDQALSGYGKVGNDMWAPYDPAYPKDVPQREQDIEQAKSLLSQAGYGDGLSFVAYTSNIAPGIVKSTEVMAEQAKAAGVTMKIEKIDPSAYYADNFLKWRTGPDWYLTRDYLPQAKLNMLWNEAHFEDEKWTALVNEAFQTVDKDKRNELVRECYKIEYETGPVTIWSTIQVVDGYVKNVAGVVPDAGGVPFNGGSVNELWLT